MSVIMMNMRAVRWYEAVSAQANSRSDVKRSVRSQNSRLQKGLPA